MAGGSPYAFLSGATVWAVRSRQAVDSKLHKFTTSERRLTKTRLQEFRPNLHTCSCTAATVSFGVGALAVPSPNFKSGAAAISAAIRTTVRAAWLMLLTFRLWFYRTLLVAFACVLAMCAPRTAVGRSNVFIPVAQAETSVMSRNRVQLYDASSAPKRPASKPTKREDVRRGAATRQRGSPHVQPIRYSSFLNAIQSGQLARAVFSADMKRVLAVGKNGEKFKLEALPDDPDLLNTLRKHKVDISIMPSREKSGASYVVRSVVVPIILFGLLFYITRRLQSGSLGPMSSIFDLQKSGARFSMVPQTGVTFADVAGMDNAKLELEELVEFLRESDRFTELGATIPRGVIVEGPPGTGKTLLARAVAGEAGVPFYSISGSEFVEMFVGVGASRVRDLFAQARKNAPCIIFIDEIDAVGRQRGAGFAGGNDEREQTLNQLLTEMDGFEGNMGIIVMAATNRVDILDSALLRPGRFDRRVTVGLPDFQGRTAILRVHARNKPIAPNVSFESVSRRTPGFSGASLQNLLNEAAIRAARQERSVVSQDDIDSALERIMLGAEKKHQVMSAERKLLVAYHEAGHAVVGAMVPDYDAIHKISIVPRGGAGGLTYFAPDENRVESALYSRHFLEGQLSVALGGRVSEEIVFGVSEVTTGAADDLQQVTRIARQMVMRFGFSKEVGQVVVESDQPESPFMRRRMIFGGDGGHTASMELRKVVDIEVSKLINRAYNTAREVLKQNRALLEDVVALLMQQETVSATELQELISRQPQVYMVPYNAPDVQPSER